MEKLTFTFEELKTISMALDFANYVLQDIEENDPEAASIDNKRRDKIKKLEKKINLFLKK